MRIALAAAAVVMWYVAPAWAQAPTDATPARVRGTVEKLDGNVLTVKTRDGQPQAITLAPDYKVSALVKKTLADIKQNDFVASAGVKGTDGKIHAVEVRIFPEALRGAGEGQRPWDQSPDSVMTNASVTGTAAAPNGQVLTVTYKGTTSDYIVGPECPIFGYVAGDASLLKPGAAVFVSAQKHPDGSLTASRITAEKDGVKPQM
ncbi:MAG TPA: hypothetical protein VHY35_03585 [Stellaceae bacterium]|jgi:hypothetical protein|nr:hypothetical protein [Stellaceae bacterium]